MLRVVIDTKIVISALNFEFGWQMEVTREVLNDFRGFSHVVNPSETIAIISYAPDNRILECAVAGLADCIISGDHHLTDLKTYGSIKIVTPTEFLAIIDQQM